MTKTKYKQTKIGEIPDDWEVVKLGTLTEIVGGGTPNTKISKYWNGNIYWFTPTELKKKYVEESKRTITEVGVKTSSAKLLPKNTILFTTRATIGLASIASKECSTNQGFQSLLPNENYHTEYLYYWLIQNPNEFISKASGSTFLEISKKDVSKIKIPLPPLPEQRKIAKILSTWDKAIESQQKLIKQKQQLKKALMQQLLTGKKRFDGFNEEWKRKRLGDVLDYEQPTKYLVSNTEYSDDYEVPVLTAGKTFILGYTNENSGLYLDLPVIIFDDFTTASKFVDFQFKVKSSAMKILKPKLNVNIKLVYEIIQTLNFDAKDHKRYWISEFQEQIIKIPTLKEQQKIASVLSSADNEIKKLENQLEILQQQKKGLMQQLLTGQKRVEV